MPQGCAAERHARCYAELVPACFEGTTSSTRRFIPTVLSLKKASAVPFQLALLGCGLWSLACSANNTYVYTDGTEPDAGVPREPDLGAEGTPVADTEATSLALDMFGSVGARYWFVVSEQQVTLMNEAYSGGGLPGPLGDIYTPGGQGNKAFADHLLVTTPGDEPHTADFGKIQVSLVGASTARPWTAGAPTASSSTCRTPSTSASGKSGTPLPPCRGTAASPRAARVMRNVGRHDLYL